jgi:hypothetical protein
MHVLGEGPATVNAANDSWSVRVQRIGNNVTYTVTVICVSAL